MSRVGANTGDDGSPASNEDEEQYVEIDEPSDRYGTHYKEIARPERFRMALHELAPCFRAVFRSGIEPFLGQNVGDHRLTDRAETELLQLSEDSQESQLIFTTRHGINNGLDYGEIHTCNMIYRNLD